MKSNEKIIFGTGIVLVVIGLFLTLGFVINVTDGTSEDSLTGDLAALLILGICPVAFGLFLCLRMKRNAFRRKAEALENRILKLAKDNKGVLTVQRLALKTELSLPQSKKVLEDYFTKGYCQIAMSDEGVVVYHFGGLKSE